MNLTEQVALSLVCKRVVCFNLAGVRGCGWFVLSPSEPPWWWSGNPWKLILIFWSAWWAGSSSLHLILVSPIVNVNFIWTRFSWWINKTFVLVCSGAITEYHRWSSSCNGNVFFHSSGGWLLHGRFLARTLFLGRRCLLTLRSQGLSSVHKEGEGRIRLSDISPYKGTWPIRPESHTHYLI